MGKCKMMNQGAGKRGKWRLGRRLNHSRPRDCGGQEVLSPAGRGMSGRGRPADNRLPKVALKGRHGFREEVASNLSQRVKGYRAVKSGKVGS